MTTQVKGSIKSYQGFDQVGSGVKKADPPLDTEITLAPVADEMGSLIP
jgi:hypothetical protein